MILTPVLFAIIAMIFVGAIRLDRQAARRYRSRAH